MMRVKRYTLSCPNPDGFVVEPFDADLLEPTVIVRGSDYDALAARLAEAERGAARYEKLRRLNVPQFKALFDRNICTGEPFDSLVDQIITDSAPAVADTDQWDAVDDLFDRSNGDLNAKLRADSAPAVCSRCNGHGVVPDLRGDQPCPACSASVQENDAHG